MSMGCEQCRELKAGLLSAIGRWMGALKEIEDFKEARRLANEKNYEQARRIH